jgi:hypothetical protein
MLSYLCFVKAISVAWIFCFWNFNKSFFYNNVLMSCLYVIHSLRTSFKPRRAWSYLGRLWLANLNCLTVTEESDFQNSYAYSKSVDVVESNIWKLIVSYI